MSDVRNENQDTFVVLAPFSKYSFLSIMEEIDSDDDEAFCGGSARQDVCWRI